VLLRREPGGDLDERGRAVGCAAGEGVVVEGEQRRLGCRGGVCGGGPRHDGGRTIHITRAHPAGAGVDRAAPLEGLRRGARAGVGGLIERVVGVALDPLEAVGAADERLVDLLEQLDVHHGLAVGLAPSLALPARHPLGDAVDHVLAVAQDEQVVGQVGRRAEELQHGHELALVVGGVLPAARRPAVVVDVPRPAGRTGVAER
jgi:hypothetical protein